jgi:hypothetical protein
VIKGMGPKGELWEGWGQLCKMRQLICSMGPEQTGIPIRATKATTPSRDFPFGNPFVDYYVSYSIVIIMY